MSQEVNTSTAAPQPQEPEVLVPARLGHPADDCGEPLNFAHIKTGGVSTSLLVLLAMLKFIFSKPKLPDVFFINPEACVRYARMVKRSGSNGSAVNWAFPDDDPRWLQPKLASTLKPAVIVPLVTMGKKPQGFNLILAEWDGVQPIFDVLRESGVKAAYLGFDKNIGSVGSYVCEKVEVPAEYAGAYASIKWPTPAEIKASVKKITLAELIAQEQIYKFLAEE
ncbi:MAG TPA: hypothetical protein VGP72_06495 [Planctomycetota bacterium]|jgi:hypothetical protein